jgi:hypothetical protein
MEKALPQRRIPDRRRARKEAIPAFTNSRGRRSAKTTPGRMETDYAPPRRAVTTLR